MAGLGLHGVIRGKPIKTTTADRAAPCPLDHVNRQFHAPAPNMLWLSDFTYVSTWGGFVYVAFVIDAYARRIVGWRVSRTAHASFVLDALEQALHERRPARRGGLVHHSDRGSQYVGIRYTERLAEAGIEPSVGSVGDSPPSGSLGSDEDRAAAGKGVEDETIAAGAVLDGVRHKGHGLDRPMHGELVEAAGLEGVDSRVVPDV
jgi:transposase InsO family protein